MSMAPVLFQIEPDLALPGRWQFVDHERGKTVGGFKTAKDARRAYEREKRRTAA